MTNIRKLIYLSDAGLQTRTEDGAISNLGGVSNATGTFTVNGKGLLFDDGTSTSGGPGHGGGGSSATLQTVYNNSFDANGNASITLQTGKDFAIYDDNNNSVYFQIASTTGAVTITGDLTVLGATTIQNPITVSDHIALRPDSPSTVTLSIEPDAGVTPIADLINVKKVNGGSSVFRVDASGKTIASTLQVTGNITVIGTINGVDIVALDTDVNDHLAATLTPKHTAAQIKVIPNIPTLPGVTNVQDALQGLATQIANVSIGNTVARGYEFVQQTPVSPWIITHNQNTRKIQFTLYDDTGNWILPNSFSVIDENTVQVGFGQPQAGSAILMMF